jgi:hypothetical protein
LRWRLKDEHNAGLASCYTELLSLSDEAHIHALKPTDGETLRLTLAYVLRRSFENN